jgi:phage FluMu protein Com
MSAHLRCVKCNGVLQERAASPQNILWCPNCQKDVGAPNDTHDPEHSHIERLEQSFLNALDDADDSLTLAEITGTLELILHRLKTLFTKKPDSDGADWWKKEL